VPSSPITLPVFSLGTATLANAIVSAIMMAAPTPCTARAAINPPSHGDTPHNSDPAVNRPMPSSISRRRPITSPKRPALTITVVMASRYASTTHCTEAKPASKVCASVGNATFAMLVPSAGNSIAKDRLANNGREAGIAG
jgi:hypothetical protein